MRERKTIKSFVKRQRRLGITKQNIFNEMWPKYGLSVLAKPLTPETIFGRRKHLVLEVGCGNGETIFALAQQYPEQDFIGIEVYKPGVAHLLTLLKTNPLDNIRIYNDDAAIVLPHCIPNQSLDKVLILFPDPWPKKRHHKRRLIQPEFLTLLHQKLKPHGILNIVTDWENYAHHINTIVTNSPCFSLPHSASNPPLSLFQGRLQPTKFEQRGKDHGRPSIEMLFVNNPNQ